MLAVIGTSSSMIRKNSTSTNSTNMSAVSSLSHSMLPVEGLVKLIVRGAGFAVTSHHAVCRVTNLPGAAVSFDSHVVPATVLNATALTCTPAAVHSEGLGSLSVSMDNKTFFGDAPLRFQPLFTVALDRRPYLAETRGHILVDLGGRAASAEWRQEAQAMLSTGGGGGCSSNASIGPHQLGTWAHSSLSSTAPATAFEFNLEGLPTTLVGTLVLSIECPAAGVRLTKYREFQRYPPPAVTGGGSTSQVDHSRAGLLVDGEPWLGIGWYYSLLDMALYEPGYAPDCAKIAELAAKGVNQLMIYSLADAVMPGGIGPNATERKMILDAWSVTGYPVIHRLSLYLHSLFHV
jgi:hypothetical protein